MHDMDDRIILDYDSVCSDIEGILNDVQSLRNERIFSQALGKDATLKLKEHEGAVKKRLSDKFSLVIIGDFKRGKSTLINAILGESILPSAVTPETVTINRVSYSETPKAEAVLENGKRAALDISELKRDILERLLNKLPAPIDYIDVKANNEMLRDISVVDTPGVGDLMNVFDEKVSGYLASADALVYVVSARAPFSMSEQMFLSNSVVPQSFSQIMVVVNMVDILETEENIEKIFELTKERTDCVGENIQVFMLSALDELCRKKGADRPCEELQLTLENNFLAFETALNRDIILQKDIIKSARCVALAQIMLRDIHARIELVKNSINIGIENLNSNVEDFQNQDSELKMKIEKHKTDIAASIDEMKYEAKKWMSDFMGRLKIEMQNIQSSTSMSDVERHFQFYMMDTIKNAVGTCVKHHQQEIADLTSKTIKEMAQETTQQVFGDVSTTVADCISDVSWTGADTAAFTLHFLGLEGNFGIFSMVGQAVLGFIRQKKVSERQTDFIAPVLKEYDSIVLDVTNSITNIYDQLKYKSVDILDEVYQKQAQASVSAVEQATEIMRDETAKKEDVIHYLDSVLERVNDFDKVLDKYK